MTDTEFTPQTKMVGLVSPEPLESKFITLPSGIKAHYIEVGEPDAPPLILTHGFLSSLNDWRDNMMPLSQLGKSRRVIALDWVGFGLSDRLDRIYSLYYFADYLRDFAEALGIQSFDLMGHSMGGKHNLAFAVMYPHYIKKMVLVDTDGFVKDPWWTNYTTTLFKPIGLLTSKLLGKTWFLKQFAAQVFYDPKFYPSAERLAEGAKFNQLPDTLAAVRAMNRSYPNLSLKLTGLRERLPKLDIPTLLIWGLQDKILHINNAYIAQAEIPGSQLHVFNLSGHLPQLEHADEFNQMVVKFLDS